MFDISALELIFSQKQPVKKIRVFLLVRHNPISLKIEEPIKVGQ